MSRRILLKNRLKQLAQIKRNTAFRLTVSLLISIYLIVFIQSEFTYRHALNTLEEGSSRYSIQTVTQANRQIDTLLRQFEELGDYLAFDQEIQNKLRVFVNSNNITDVELAYTYLASRMSNELIANRMVASITIISEDQTHVVSTLRRDAAVKELRSDNAEAIRGLDWFQSILNTDKHSFFLDTRRGGFLSNVHRIENPANPDKRLGILVLELSADSLRNALDGFKLGDSGGYAVVNEDGKIIYTADESLIATDFHSSIPKSEREGIFTDTFYTSDNDGVLQHVAYDKSELSGWYLLGYYPKEELLAPMREMLQNSLWISILSSTAAAIIVFLMVHRGVGKPLHKLRMLMQEGENGNFHVRTDSQIDTEIGDLGRAFDRMMDQITLAYYDSLTNLPNRRLLVDRLEATLALAEKHGRQLSVLFVDLDRFKMINDSLGHHAGDMLIQAVGQRLQQNVDIHDMVARISGDEFVILLSESTKSETLDRAETLLRELRKPYSIMEHELHITGSIGVAFYPEDGRDPETLIKYADMAMYEAKAKGKNTYKLYSSELTIRSQERMRIETDLHRAIENEDFELYYQPRVDARSGEIVGCEALLRWPHSTLGMIPPDKFIPVAEETGLIVPLGEWVIKEACRQNRAWQDAGFEKLRIAVNVSAKQFENGLVESVQRLLEQTGLDGTWLEIEITERVLMENEATIKDTISGLKALGLHISIDDFGTGYSSLAFLMKFQVDTLKIDKSFVRNIDSNKENQTIASAVIQLAHNLGINVVSEGVETKEEYEFLLGRGSDEMQGYYMSRPLPAHFYEERFLRK